MLLPTYDGDRAKGESVGRHTTLIKFYDDELEMRYSNYLVEHNMLDTFNDEDHGPKHFVRILPYERSGLECLLAGRGTTNHGCRTPQPFCARGRRFSFCAATFWVPTRRLQCCGETVATSSHPRLDRNACLLLKGEIGRL